MRKRASHKNELFPEEVLIDAGNLAECVGGGEGKLHRSLDRWVFAVLFFGAVSVLCIFGGRAVQLMAIEGDAYRSLSENNRLSHALVFAERGVVYDSRGVELAWNIPYVREGVSDVFYDRQYASTTGIAHMLGYVRAPARDKSGVLYRFDAEGVSGVEATFNELLSGKNGVKIVETSVTGERLSESVFTDSVPGAPLTLSVDVELQSMLHDTIARLADDVPFVGGAGVIMDVRTGELLALTSVPEYDIRAVVSGDNTAIQGFGQNTRLPYLNRVIHGQYTPGSIIKPVMTYAALAERVVDAHTSFYSSGSVRLENPYNHGEYAVFRDWKAHGDVDAQRALAVSSNVYFYYIGGGFGSQEGLGISRIARYMRMFGFGGLTGFESSDGEESGTVPTPDWKKETFPQDPDWRIGDTYHTSIGQYGFQVTPLQVVRMVAAIANGGTLLTPRIETQVTPYGARDLHLDLSALRVVQEGMRAAVTEGTAKGLFVPYVDVAAKTGTAEVGYSKAHVHSWAVGFFPYEQPKYAFAVVMEHGPRENVIGGVYVMRQMLDWMHTNRAEYFQ
jgi:penicillin-binding protein 2